MHSWVFRNRHQLEALYGPKARVVPSDVQPVECASYGSVTSDPGQVDLEAEIEPWPSIERREGGVVILHPAVSIVPRIKSLPTYRRGA